MDLTGLEAIFKGLDLFMSYFSLCYTNKKLVFYDHLL